MTLQSLKPPLLIRTLQTGLCILTASLGLATVASGSKFMEKSFPVSAGGSLTLICESGDIIVEGSSRDDIRLVILSSQDLEKNFSFAFKQDGNALRILSARKSGEYKAGRYNLGMQFKLSVPDKLNLELETSSGHIAVSALECPSDSLPLKAKATGGEIRLEQVRARAVIKAVGGDIRVKGLTGPISAETSGGEMQVELAESPRVECSLLTGGGNISFSLPSASDADFTVETSGGAVTSGPPLELIAEPGSPVFTGRLGEGGVKIGLKAAGGKIQIKPYQQ
ncbi:MAG: hypothetical protein A2Z86_09325 [Candidatus Glassbacteria bacterium GWA2_58_10]|uniref:DUF4097 domain-containing protein n=1 Tax=Candidatus Glassbacteria bacterium GWA2_58_10 TaxID=1817865 RepID=A0A1F5YDF3_9BACT|nr:MAG: hypothetical protein A2Z86_09325 [Candidatus Glassbacteria bacterium GWA2_58_10]